MFRGSTIALAVVLVLSATGLGAGGAVASTASPAPATPADAGVAFGQNDSVNGTLTLNTTTVAPGGAIRFTVTATRGPVQFVHRPPYSIQRRIDGEWKSFRRVILPVLTEPIRRGESRSWTWSPGRLTGLFRPGDYRVVFDGRSGDLVARFRVTPGRPTLAVRPAETAVGQNETATLDVVLRAAIDPVTVDASLVVTDPATAAIVGVSGHATPNATVSPNGTGVRIAGNVTAADDGPVTLATVRIRGRSRGRANLVVRTRENATDGNASGSLRVEGATVDVVDPRALEVGGTGRPATDPDADGRREDVTGDGSFDIVDVAVFLETFDAVDPRAVPAFDFDGSGRVDVLDVAALLAEL